MKLFYDADDAKLADKIGSQRLFWLDDIGAVPIQEANREEEGYLFSFDRGITYYRELVGKRLGVRDRPKEREELIDFDRILTTLNNADIDLPVPRTWILQIDQELPRDLTFPLFIRTAKASWKRGGQTSCVNNFDELQDEMYLLRRAFQWDAPIIAREWLYLANAGHFRYGPIPQEIRVLFSGVTKTAAS